MNLDGIDGPIDGARNEQPEVAFINLGQSSFLPSIVPVPQEKIIDKLNDGIEFICFVGRSVLKTKRLKSFWHS